MPGFYKNVLVRKPEEARRSRDVVLSTKQSYTICADCKHYKSGGYNGSFYPATCYAKVNRKDMLDFVTGQMTDEKVKEDIVLCKEKNHGHCPDFERAEEFYPGM